MSVPNDTERQVYRLDPGAASLVVGGYDLAGKLDAGVEKGEVMTKVQRWLALMGWLLCPWLALAAAPVQTLTFAPLPMQTPEEVVRQIKPMLVYLEQQLGVQVNIRYVSSYAELLALFRQGQIDLTYLGPLPYVSLRAGYAQATPLVHFREKDGQASYTCALVAADAVGAETWRDKRVALTQPLSTCGYLSVAGLMHQKKQNLEHNRYRYLGTHDAVALAVTRGEFELGGMKTAIARKYAHMGLQVLAETAPLPGFALVGNGATLSEGVMSLIAEVLLRLDGGKTPEVLAGFGESFRYGSVTATDADYDGLRGLKVFEQIPDKGNF